MKTKLTLLLTTSVLAVAGFMLVSTTPGQAAGFSTPAPLEHSTRFCGSHNHHHCHYWTCGDREFWCPGHDD